MQHDFNLVANGAQQIDVSGRFFKYVSGTGKIRVRTDRGGYIDILPGQGVSNEPFSYITVQDKTGLPNVGVILAGDFDFRDERITGTVDVVDGGKARTNTDTASIGYAYCGPVASTAAHVQLFNPAGSGKNMYVEQVSFFSTGTVGNGIALRWLNTPLSAVYGNGNRKRNGAATSGAEVRTQNNASVLGTGNYLMALDKAMRVFKFTEPMEIQPGCGLVLINATSGEDLGATIEYFEETI